MGYRAQDLNDRSSYILTLNVTTGAGAVVQLCSEPLRVDVDPPLPGVVVDGGADTLPNATGTLFVANGTVKARWSGFSDYSSGVAAYSVRVCDASGFVCLTNWTNVGAQTDVSLAHLALEDGVTYRVHVRGFDVAGNAIDAVSPGQIHDSSEPQPPARIIVEPGTISAWKELSIEFDDFVDAESGISGYAVQVEVRSGAGCAKLLLPYSNIGLSTQYTLSGDALLLAENTWRHGSGVDNGMRPAVAIVTIRATNRVGASSFRTALVRLDDTAPLPGEVAFQSVDALPNSNSIVLRDLGAAANGSNVGRVEALVAELDLSNPPRFQVSRHALSLAFRGFSDPDADSYRPADQLVYSYAVGSAPGRDDAVLWSRFFIPEYNDLNSRPLDRGYLPGTDPFMVHTIDLSGLDIRNGATVYASVRATNAAGLSTTVSSKPITIDATTPQSRHPQPLIDMQARVLEEWNATAYIAAQNETDVISANETAARAPRRATTASARMPPGTMGRASTAGSTPTGAAPAMRCHLRGVGGTTPSRTWTTSSSRWWSWATRLATAPSSTASGGRSQRRRRRSACTPVSQRTPLRTSSTAGASAWGGAACSSKSMGWRPSTAPPRVPRASSPCARSSPPTCRSACARGQTWTPCAPRLLTRAATFPTKQPSTAAWPRRLSTGAGEPSLRSLTRAATSPATPPSWLRWSLGACTALHCAHTPAHSSSRSLCRMASESTRVAASRASASSRSALPQIERSML